MYCVKCGAKIAEGYQFCKKCGERVEADIQLENNEYESDIEENFQAESKQQKVLRNENVEEKTERVKKRRIIPLILVIVAIIAGGIGVWLLVSQSQPGNKGINIEKIEYLSPVEKYIELLNQKETTYEEYVKVINPEYFDLLVYDNYTYERESQQLRDLITAWKLRFGNDYQITARRVSEREMTVQELDEEIAQIANNVGIDVQIEQGYLVGINFEIKGSKKSEVVEQNFNICKINGQWSVQKLDIEFEGTIGNTKENWADTSSEFLNHSGNVEIKVTTHRGDGGYRSVTFNVNNDKVYTYSNSDYDVYSNYIEYYGDGDEPAIVYYPYEYNKLVIESGTYAGTYFCVD